MKLSTHVKPITDLKANASEESFEAMQETLALLKILALGKAQVEKGEFVGIEDVRSHFANKS